MVKRRKDNMELEAERGDDNSDVAVSGDTSENDDSEMEVGSSGDEAEEEEENNSEGGFSEIQADFEFFDPKEGDFQGLKGLLGNYLDGAEANMGEIVDAIVKQTSVGSVLKCGEEGHPIGVVSVLNFKRYANLKALQEIKAFILKHCNDPAQAKKFEKVMESSASGLLMNERLLNCPPQLGPPLQQALFDEINWATEDEPTQELRDSFKFEQYVLLTRVFKDPALELAEGSKNQNSKKGKKKKSKSEGPVGFVYVRPEDEFFHQFCSSWFCFSVENRPSRKNDLEPLRLALVITASQVSQARAALDAVVGNVAMQDQE